MRNPRCFVATVAACVALASMLVTASPAPRPQAQQASQGSADPHPAVALMEQMCNRCHDSARILATRRTSLEWEDIINKMIEKGAAGTGQEFETVFAYLLAHHGKIFINDANADEIVKVLELSRKDAEAIVAYRTTNGPFADAEAVRKVPDIDLKTLDAHIAAVAFPAT